MAKRNLSKAAAFVLSSMIGLSALPAAHARGGEAGASSAILINASPEVVWRAVHEERMHDPDLAYVKFLSKSGNTATIEEKFVSVPVIGSVTAVLHQEEVPLKRIDYSLISSDKFKRMEGSWSLTPMAGNKTLLKLSSFLDVGVPFSGPFIKGATQKKIEKRIGNVKRVAEREQARLAAEGSLHVD